MEERVEEPYRLTPLAASDDGAAFALHDPFGTVAFDLHAAAEGPDVWLAIASARSAAEGPAPPAVRVLAAARTLGLSVDASRGALSLRRALSAALSEALVPRGWRVPDDRGVRIALTMRGPRTVELSTLATDAREPANDPAPWEVARRLAPVVIALGRGETEEARRVWEATRERLGQVPAALAREAASLGLFPPTEGEDPLALTLALRRAAREGHVRDAALHARALADIEPCDGIAVEALCAAADLALDDAPALGAELLERAVARRPRDARIALRLLEALCRQPDGARLRTAVDAALAAREPGPERAELARDAASICELAERREEAARLFRVASEGLPHDGRVLFGVAAAEERAGRPEDALRLFDRAADAFAAEADDEGLGRALRRSARMAEKLGRAEVVEERLARAAEHAPHDPEVWAALAEIRHASGAASAALRAEGRLLESLETAGVVSTRVAQALAGAASRALDRRELERARAFTGYLARAHRDHPALADLTAALEAASPEPAGTKSARSGSERPSSGSDSNRAGSQPRRTEPASARSGSERPSSGSDSNRAGSQPRRTEPASARSGSERPSSGSDSKQAEGSQPRRTEPASARRGTEHASSDSERAEPSQPRRSESASEPSGSTSGRRNPSGASRSRAAGLASDEPPVSSILRVSEHPRPREPEPDGPLSRARAAAAQRDMAGLRAALNAAERAGDWETARRVVDLALEVVGDGPARRALEATRARLDREG